MPNLRRHWTCGLAVLGLIGMLAGAVEARAQAWNADRFMDVDALKRGMEGYILTVIEDTKVEKLPIKILSVERGYFPKGSLIWAEGTNERFKHFGTAAGMSGSPAFVDDRLIGALAYGYDTAKDPIMGITPIRQMLAVWNRDMRPIPRPRRSRTRRMGFRPFSSATEWLDALASPGDARTARWTVTDDVVRRSPELDIARGASLRPIALPLLSRGLSPAAAQVVGAAFRQLGRSLLPIAQSAGSGGAASGTGDDARIDGGSVLGVEYIRGDYSLFGYGTVTYRDGDRILAFGHPMFGGGDSYMPMSTGKVHFVFASNVRSFKEASPTRVVGTIVQDRESAIAGVLQRDHAPFLPLTVRVTSKGDDAPRVYRYELLRRPDLTSTLAMVAVMSTIANTEKSSGDYTLRSKATVEFEGDADAYPPLVKENVLTGAFSPGFAAATMLLPVGTILNNWYDEIPIKNIQLDIEYDDGRDAATIETARLSKQRVRPGETIEITVTMRPYLDEPIVKRFPVQIPDDAPDGFALVFLGDSNAYENWERSRAKMRYEPSNARQLLSLLARGGTRDDLIVSVMTGRMGIAVEGAELPNLPLSMLNVMSTPLQNGESNLTRGSVLVEETFPLPFVPAGSTLLPFTIDSNAP